jgi:mono/diheme cytochrome c family protein
LGTLLRVGLLWSLAGSALALPPGDRVPNFALLDHLGAAHELHYRSDARAIVLVVHANGCETVRAAVPRLAELRDRFASQGVLFLMLNASADTARREIAADAVTARIDLPILLDSSQLVAETLHLTRSGEVLLVDPNGWRLAYRGEIEGSPPAREPFLAHALEAVLDQRAVPVAATAVRGGTPVEFAARNDPEYADVAPLLVEHCVGCHRPGGIGPFAMRDYALVRGFAPMIREALLTARMPPWHADPEYGRFRGDRSLTDDVKRKLVQWIDAGAPRGGGPDPLLKAMTGTWEEWTLGAPDLILEMPAFDVPATGVVDYQYLRVDNPLEHDVWIRATEVVPGDRAVVHHIIATAQDPGSAGSGRLFGAGSNGLGSYVPGAGPTVYPEGTGMLLRAGAQIVMQMHYTPSGRATADASRIGLYFADVPPRHRLRTAMIANFRFAVPPHARSHTDSASHRFDRDVLIYKLMPHAHYRGRSAAYRAHLPDGSEEVLLSVPNFDFNWQTTYALEEPKRLPAGTRIEYVQSWDNSAQNRANPDPDATVRWGDQSWQEMLIGWTWYRFVDEAP